jgi:hypothetical protein
MMVSDEKTGERMRTLKSGLQGWLSRYRHVESGLKYILLCLYIAVTLLILPFLGLDVRVLIIIFIAFAAIVIYFTYWVSDAGDVRILILLLAAAAVFERLTLISGRTELRIIGLSLTLVIVGALTAFFLFKVVLARHPIRAHIIWAAISIYLLLGVLYAIAFEIVGTIITGSILYNPNMAQVLSTSDYIYYSYSTLFTLSYGDYIPVSSIARGMALMEVLIGAFFMAIIISKLVGYTGLMGYEEDSGDDDGRSPESEKQLAEMNDRLSRMEQMLTTIQKDHQKK